MVLSVGTQLPDFQAFSNLLPSNRGGQVGASSSTPDVSRFSKIPDEIVELSDGAFEALGRGLETFRQADLSLARQRLNAAADLLEFTRSLLGGSSPEQRESLLGSTQNLGDTLENLASQLSQIFSGNKPASYGETLSAEFNYASITVHEEAFTVTQTEDGVEIQRSVEQTQLVVAELKIESTQTLSVGGHQALPSVLNAGEQLENTLNRFRSLVQDFQSLIGDLLKDFTADQIQPEVPVDVLEAFLEQFSKIGTQSS